MQDSDPYESALSSLSSDEEDELMDESESPHQTRKSTRKSAAKKRAKKARKDSDEEYEDYSLGHALKVPRATTYPTESLFNLIQQGDIELNPEYQRDVVWPESKQMSLIDSILRNFYVPPVIFMVKSYDDGSEERVCIDGKQRLTSIERFMNGLIPYRDPETKEKLWYKDTPGVPGKKVLLPQRYRTLFANKQVVCVEYQELDNDDERDVFQRVQLGMALTPSERLQVISSPRANFVRNIINTKFCVNSTLSTSLKWDRKRGNDFKAISQLIMILEKLKNNPKELPKGIEGVPSIEKYLKQEDELHSSIQTRVERTCDIYAQLASSDDYNYIFETVKGTKQKFSPVEFTFAAVLIARNYDKLSLGQLASAIGGMRENVRTEHVDIRGNGRVCKTLSTYIKNLKPSDVPNAPSTKSSGKRKRVSTAAASDDESEDVDDDEVDYNPKSKSKKKSSSSSPAKKKTVVAVKASSATTGGQKAKRTGGKPGQSSSSARVSHGDAHIKPDPDLPPAAASASAPPGGSQETSVDFERQQEMYKHWFQQQYPGVPVPPMGPMHMYGYHPYPGYPPPSQGQSPAGQAVPGWPPYMGPPPIQPTASGSVTPTSGQQHGG